MATTLKLIGAEGGQPFTFTGCDNGATLKKIGVAVGPSAIKAVRAELTDGRVETFGYGQSFSEFTFKPNEIITKLSLWANNAGTRLGGIKFWTSSGNKFCEQMNGEVLKTEYSIDVGSGVCLGLEGRSGAEIDKMGFLFINAIKSSELTDVTYPSLATYTPQVNMATTLKLIGAEGGQPFTFTGCDNGATLKKIGVAVGPSAIKAVRAELTDGRVETFGYGQSFSEFTFKPNEIITRLSLWANNAGTRLGGIKFWTSSGNKFCEQMNGEVLKTEYSIDVGSGVCLGLEGRSGAEIDKMGFLFINAIKSSELTDVTYPSLATYTPQVNKEYIKSHFYHNGTATDQEQKSTYSRSLTKSSTWSTTSEIETSLSVTARIPDVFETSSGFGMTLGVEQTSSMTKEETKKIESEEVNVTVPARKTVSVEFSIGRAVINLPFSATVKIICLNGSELEFKSTGNYNGVAFTAVDVKTTESDYV